MEAIKKLRERTGAGMVDCKKALDEASGDIEAAIEILRKKGIAKAAKRAEREANEGLIKTAVSADGQKGWLLEVNSETDFVARNADFQTFVDQALALAQEKQATDVAGLLALTMADGSTVKDNLEHLSGVIGEKLSIGFLGFLSGVSVGNYTHAGGSLGVLVSLNQPDKSDLARDIAMQIAASQPRYIKPEEVPAAELDKEKDVYREQLKQEGKPAEMIEKILTGKVNKYLEEVCLIKQEYIKDEKQKVENILGGAVVEKFIRHGL